MHGQHGYSVCSVLCIFFVSPCHLKLFLNDSLGMKLFLRNNLMMYITHMVLRGDHPVKCSTHVITNSRKPLCLI
jgi:hypothetical protein